MYAISIYLHKDDVAQYSLLKKLLRYHMHEILFMEVLSKNLTSAMEHIDVDNIIVIHILDLNDIIVVRTFKNFVACRVHLHIEVKLLLSTFYHGISLDKRILIEHHRRLTGEFS